MLASLTDKGLVMTTVVMVTYKYSQMLDLARPVLP